jgi:toxin-antitoxin system PIN domain toxin
MIIPDVNLLLYAYNSTCAEHAKAARWWSDCLSGAEPVGLPHVVLFAFARIATRPVAFDPPLTIADASGHVRSWLDQPNVQLLLPGDGHCDRVLDLLQQTGTGGNLVTDAQLAALAIEQHAVLHTADADFLRFPGVRWFNPITGIGSETLRKGRRG